MQHAPSLWMGGGLESCRMGHVYGADGAVHGTICTVNTIYAAALKTTTHHKLGAENHTLQLNI